MLLRTKPNRLRFLLTASSTLAPALAWSQVAELETVLLKPNSQVPVANTWYIDEAGNFVLMSEAQRHSYELAQLPTDDIPLQTLTEAAPSLMGVPMDLIKQLAWYSAGVGGLAGGVTAATLAWPKGDTQLVSGAGEQGPAGPQGEQGPAGPAGEAGQDGTDGADGEAGQNGSDGDSAYQVWLDAGNTGLEEDFLNSLRGADGTDGSDGKSAYQIWTNAGNTGTHQDFLDSLKGADGQDRSNGADGATGSAGQDGADGVFSSRAFGWAVLHPRGSCLSERETSLGLYISRRSIVRYQ